MLTPEIMGALALWILWVNCALIAAAALKRSRRLGGWRRPRVLGGVDRVGGPVELRGRIVEGRGPGGAFARHRVTQVGRALDGDADAMVFHDRHYEGELLGGAVEVGGERVDVPARASARVFVDRALQHDRQGEWEAASDFASAYRESRRPKGYVRLIEVDVAVSDSVWIQGRLAEVDGRWTLTAPDDATDPGEALLVSAFDPRRWVRARQLELIAFSAATLFGAGVCTVVALWPPVFGAISTLGALLGLAYFLLIMPAGTAMRDRAREPDLALLRGIWTQPDSARGSSAAPALES